MATFLTFIFGVGLLLAAVWVIWRLGNDDVSEPTKFTRKIAALTCFSGVFAAWVAFFTNAKRAEIFSFTAAYTAVLIVFVGTS